jgi:predicted alpha/beta-hydrolase family hydrolase
MAADEIEIRVEGGAALPALWTTSDGAGSVVVLAHGAGSGMRSPFLEGFAEEIAALGHPTLRFDFPYMAAGRRAPDRPPVLIASWREAFADAGRRGGGRPVAAAGKSMGGRIASMAAAEGMPAAALVFLGYPLHPPGRPEQLRDAHLPSVAAPMLFLQGTRDAFAQPDLLRAVVGRLGPRAELLEVTDADHSFKTRGERRDARQIGASLAPAAARFLASRTVT